MSHVSLYRKYRPDTLDKVFGQEHIVRTLSNQITAGTISHAYLFTGTRGIGKTSVARIFARAINCISPVNGSPCGKCENCRALAEMSNLDIIEIDAASNNGVDEIRDLREKVKYPPVQVPYKVYIIDEVHMLTPQAFNALLKTLEEPPRHAVFILATTEAHKLPATILSRCQRFDFRLVPVSLLSQNLEKIFIEEGKPYEPEAVKLIAAAGEGSVRDSLSIADMCMSFCDGTITYSGVLDALGASDPNVIVNLAKSIVERDISAALGSVNDLAVCGKNMAVLSSDLAECFRNLLYIKNSKNAEGQLGLPKTIFDSMKQLADGVTNGRILAVLDIFTTVSGELRYSNQQRIIVEAAVARAICESEGDSSAVMESVKRLEAKVNGLVSGAVKVAAQPATEKAEKAAKPTKAEEKKEPQVVKIAAPVFEDIVEEKKAEKPVEKEADIVEFNFGEAVVDDGDNSPEGIWRKTVKQLMAKRFMALAFAVEKVPYEVVDGVLKLSVMDKGDVLILHKTDNQKALSEAYAAVTGESVSIKIIEGADAPENTTTEGELICLFGAGRFRKIDD